MKRSIFSAIYVLIKDDEPSFMITMIFTTIQFVQLHFFIFRDEFKTTWNANDLSETIQKIINYFLIYPYFKSTSWSIYIMIFYILNIYVVILLCNMAFVAYSARRGRFTLYWPVQTLRFGVWLSTTVLFLPILQIF